MHEEQAAAPLPADNTVILDAGVSQQGLVGQPVLPREVGDEELKKKKKLTSRRFS